MKMKERLQRWTINYGSRKMRQETFDFPASIQGSKRMLLTLPHGIQTNSQLLRMIAELPVIFPSSDLLVVVPVGCSEITRKTGLHAISPELNLTNWIGLPKQEFFAKVSDYKATVLIDFETRKNVFNAMVALHSGAGLRIGLANVWGMPLHNFLVKSEFQTDELKTYRHIVDLLTSIQLPSAASKMGGLD
jgi:hypothetical protein